MRAVGSNHSTAACGVADGGTLIRMKMNRILSIGPDTPHRRGRRHSPRHGEGPRGKGLQFYVNTEIGNLSAGSAACAGTKDASFPGEYGQVGSYVSGSQDGAAQRRPPRSHGSRHSPDLMQNVRSSYGLFGIVYEVTYKIRPLTPMHVHHTTYSLRTSSPRCPTQALRLFDDVLHVSLR